MDDFLVFAMALGAIFLPLLLVWIAVTRQARKLTQTRTSDRTASK